MADTDWHHWLKTGREALQRDANAAAVAALERAHGLAPAERDVRYWLGNALRASGDHDSAARYLAALVAEDAGDAEAAFALAFLERERGRHAEAEKVLVALADHANDATRLKIVGFLRDSDCFDTARRVIDRVVTARPDDASLRFRRARLSQALGKFDQALADCRAALDRDPDLAGAWLSLAHLQRFDDADSPDLARLRAAADAARGAEARTALQFALGKARDDLDDPATAWRHYCQANRGAAALQPFDADGHHRQVEATLARPFAPPGNDPNGPRPLFIVGLLRSGTTLLEQRLGRHGRITPRGELNWLAHVARHVPDPRPLDAEMRERLATETWRQLRRDGPGDHVYVDKNPLNYRFLDIALTLFPNARVIHLRRDLCASGLSCWFQWFQHPDAAFANDRDQLVAVAHDYQTLMAHWRPLLGERMLELDYSDLVGDGEATVRRVIAWLELEVGEEASGEPSDAGTLIRTASAWQARQPVHRESIDKWRQYERFDREWFNRLSSVDTASS